MKIPGGITPIGISVCLILLSACASPPQAAPAEGDTGQGPPSILDFPDNPQELEQVYIEHDEGTHRLAAFGAVAVERSMEMGGFWVFESGIIPLRYATGPDGKMRNPRWVVGYTMGEWSMEIPVSGPAGEGTIGGESGMGYELRGYLYPAPECKLTIFITEYMGPEVTGNITAGESEVLRVQEEMYANVSGLTEQVDFDLNGVPVVVFELPGSANGTTGMVKEVFYVRYFDDPTSGCQKLAVRYSVDADEGKPDVERGDDILDDGFWERFTTGPLDEWEKEFEEHEGTGD